MSEHKRLSKDALLQLLADRGIEVDIADYGCGCCGSMELRIIIDGNKEYDASHDPDFNSLNPTIRSRRFL